MNLLFICGYKFLNVNNRVYSNPAYGNLFWEKYLEVFDSIEIIGEEIPKDLRNNKVVELNDTRISVRIIPGNAKPIELLNDFQVKQVLKERILNADAVLIKQASRKGNMAIAICKKNHKPYMIDLTADLNIELKTSGSLVKKIYRPWIYHQVKKSIKDCQFGIYVTQDYLQKVYPIEGKQFGCTDSIIKKVDDTVLENRLKRIDAFNSKDTIVIGFIATYSSNRKGMDTLIKALNLLNRNNIEVHVLGRGSVTDRNQWLEFASKYSVQSQLIFDTPLSSSEEVFNWIDDTDINVLPSRAEGLPRSIIEAMSRGCPCITSNVCGLPELIDSKWLHDPGDYETLASLLEQMIDDKEKMRNTAITNFIKAKDYEYSIISTQRKAFLEEFRKYAESYM